MFRELVRAVPETVVLWSHRWWWE